MLGCAVLCQQGSCANWQSCNLVELCVAAASSHIQVYRCLCLQDFHSRVESAVSGDDLAQLLYKVFKSGHEQEDERGAARAAQSAKCKLEIKVWSHKTYMYLGHRVLELKVQPWFVTLRWWLCRNCCNCNTIDHMQTLLIDLTIPFEL